MKADWAPKAFRALNGVFCVYKPCELTIGKVAEVLQFRILRDLNKLPCYEYERNRPVCYSSLNTTLPVQAHMPDLSEHRLVLGPRYEESDIRLFPVPSRLQKHASGVQVFGIGRGVADARIIHDTRYVCVYHVTGQLGLATQNFTPYGNIIERTSFNHVKKAMIDKICASSQASHTKLMFDYARLDLQSQEAYEAAKTGLIRPATTNTPILIYGIKCISFDLPYFTLEIHTINERCDYFKQFIHNLGLSVRSTAVCTKIHRLRYGHFTLSHALLKKHWTIENIIENIALCEENLTIDKLLPGSTLSHNVNYLNSG